MDFPKSLESAVKAYIKDPTWEARILSGGHINRTYLVDVWDSYVLQCINPDLYPDFPRSSSI